jgi:hypothetical protein
MKPQQPVKGSLAVSLLRLVLTPPWWNGQTCPMSFGKDKKKLMEFLFWPLLIEEASSVWKRR